MNACILIITIMLVYITPYYGVAQSVQVSNQAQVGSGARCNNCHNPSITGSGSPPTTSAPPVVKRTTSKSDDDVIKCGTKALIARVVGGSKASPRSWPWQIGIKSCPTCMYFCGGTIVAKRWVITAAHCLVNYRASDLYIDAGVTNQKMTTKHKQSFNCTAINQHQSYAIKAPYDEDIAILQLNKDVVFNDHVRPLCLNENTLKTGQKCTVTGYGRTSQKGKKSAHLLQAGVPIVANDVCVKAYNKTKPPRSVTKNMVCAGYVNGGVDACAGDSGGPLTCWDQNKQRYILGGIVSWGVGCARKNTYGVYTDVKHLTAWITRITGKIGSGSPPTTSAPPVVKRTTSKSDDDVIKCGTKALIARVVGGSKASPRSWPWQIGIKSCPTCMYFCGGTIVAKRWVITAAHCLVNYRASDLYIDAGVTNQKMTTKHKQSFNCTAINKHQSYAIKAPYDEDIAILQLNKDVVFNDHVRPLCLNENTLKTGQKCTVTGYGRTSQKGKKSAHLLQAGVPIVANDVCVKAYNKTKPPRSVTKNMVCAGYVNGGVDACAGDSGGPLTCWDQNKQRYVLGGIVSWGVGCAHKNTYGVYTDVKHLTAWITRITGKIV